MVEGFGLSIRSSVQSIGPRDYSLGFRVSLSFLSRLRLKYVEIGDRVLQRKEARDTGDWKL